MATAREKKSVKPVPRSVVGNTTKRLMQTKNQLETKMMQYYVNGGSQNGLIRMARYKYQEYKSL